MSLNVANCCGFLQSLKLQQLDGLHEAVLGKLTELGHGPRDRAHKSHSISGSTVPSGNIRGILRFVEHANSADDIRNLQTLEAVMSTRFKAAGYTPKKTETALT